MDELILPGTRATEARPPANTKRRTKRSAEALPGDRTFGEMRALVEGALTDQVAPGEGQYVWIRDMADDWAVYELEGQGLVEGTYRVTYTVDDDGAIELSDPAKVEARTTYETTTESVRVIGGRVIEALDAGADGSRQFRVQVIEAGDSANGRRYPLSVLHDACSLYNGVKAFDHHRTIEEMQTSSTVGLCGRYTDPAPNPRGVEATLHVLPTRDDIAAGLDASLAAEADGLPPVIGISHDVQVGGWRPVVDSGRRLTEAVSIARVFSADVVADPAAGGRALRAVAGGIDIDNPEETIPMLTLKQLIELLRSATDAAARAELLQEHAPVVEASGYTADEIGVMADAEPGSALNPEPAAPAAETVDEPELVATAKESVMGSMLIKHAVEAAGLSHVTAEITKQLPARFTESQLAATIEMAKRFTESFEAKGLQPRAAGNVAIGAEDFDKKTEKLYQTFCRNWQEGYTRLSEAYFDITGETPSRGVFDDDLAHQIVRESWGPIGEPLRAAEAVTTGTWAQALGSTMHRRLIDVFRQDDYMKWKRVASSTPISDFREHKAVRIGGFGDLPVVNQGAPYQDLGTPSDEEAVIQLEKRGGTAEFTWEAAVNDDIKSLVLIPENLGRAAGRTLHKQVFVTVFAGNPTIYDSVALFDSGGHANTEALALSAANVSVVRRKMRSQTEFGSSEPIGLTPDLLVVPNELEQTAFELCRSAVAVTTNKDAQIPNYLSGLDYLVIDELTDADDWFAVAGPTKGAGIEVGFLGGRETPDLLMQDDPKVGAVFSADVCTWKIRFVFDVAVLDYRPFQRGTQ